MKKLLLISITVITITACSNKNTETSSASDFITATAPGVPNGMRAYINKLGSNRKPIAVDTAIVMDERFTFEKQPELDTPDIRFITIDGSPGSLIFIPDDNPIELTIYKDSLDTSTITGSKPNEIIVKFKREQREYKKLANDYRAQRGNLYNSGQEEAGNIVTESWLNDEEAFKTKARSYIEKNPNSLVAPMIMGELLNAKMITTRQGRDLYNKMGDQIKQAPLSKQIDKFLANDEITAIGAKAPYFEGKNPAGDIVKLTDIMGEVTLIDFWASWCGPCRRENPNVVDAYRQYHNKGFNIISVSLDKPGAAAQWKAAIEKDNMNWNHISRLQHWKDPIAKQYGVKGIPATFLIDKNGIIIAKNLRGKALHEKLEEVL